MFLQAPPSEGRSRQDSRTSTRKLQRSTGCLPRTPPRSHKLRRYLVLWSSRRVSSKRVHLKTLTCWADCSCSSCSCHCRLLWHDGSGAEVRLSSLHSRERLPSDSPGWSRRWRRQRWKLSGSEKVSAFLPDSSRKEKERGQSGLEQRSCSRGNRPSPQNDCLSAPVLAASFYPSGIRDLFSPSHRSKVWSSGLRLFVSLMFRASQQSCSNSLLN
jgi:hypothetical protein